MSSSSNKDLEKEFGAASVSYVKAMKSRVGFIAGSQGTDSSRRRIGRFAVKEISCYCRKIR